jgi:hypothetical protein
MKKGTTEILNLYSNRYNFKNFYSIADYKIRNNKLLKASYKSISKESLANFTEVLTPTVIEGDIRVDLPIWFGNDSNSSYRIMILGREPRHTDNKFNIVRDEFNNVVFATPFGVELWTERTKYYKSFKCLFERPNLFIYFTDVVKDYYVLDSKANSDKVAKKGFWHDLSDDQNKLDFLKQEIEFLKPNVIVALGKDCARFLTIHFAKDYVVFPVVHPNARQNNINKKNAWELIQESLISLINTYENGKK